MEKNEGEIVNRLITSGCLQDINDKMIEFRGIDYSQSFHAAQAKPVSKFLHICSR